MPSTPARKAPTSKGRLNKGTYSPKPGEIDRVWHVIDANDVVLGRLASQAAKLLRGKHKPQFAQHVDTGDFVIVINAAKIAVTGQKVNEFRYRHSGYPGGLRQTTVGQLIEKKPERLIELAVRGMLPKNTLGRAQLKKLKVYAGSDHPHTAQKPQPFEIKQVSQ
ncbi:MAG: 50S ribosomal protein L13 [Jatrophihabitans sp.]